MSAGGNASRRSAGGPVRWALVGVAALLGLLGPTPVQAAERQKKARAPLSEPVDGRKFMVGVQGAISQATPLRPDVVRLDPRFVGRSVALGGLGLFGRYRPLSLLGVDVGVHSGSLRYRADEDEGAAVSQDQVLVDAAVLLYLGRGEVAQFAVSSGLGGLYNRVGYELGDGTTGRQVFGSAVVRLGADAEFLVKRVAFVLSFRSYAVITDRDRVRNSGALLNERDGGDKAPVPTLATQLMGTAGIAFRF